MGGLRGSLRLRRAIAGALGALACAAALGGATTTAEAAPGAEATTRALAAELARGDRTLAQLPEGPGSSAPRRGPAAVTGGGAWYDAIGDNEVLAPDLQQMRAATEDTGRFTVAITLDTNLLVEGDFVATYVDSDGNAATGSAVFGGADHAVGILGRTGPDVVGAFRWNGVAFEPAGLPSLESFAAGSTDEVWRISASDMGILPGVAVGLEFATLYEGIYATYFDFAPEPGAPTFRFPAGALSAPPPPPPPPAPAPVAVPVNPGAPAGAASRPLAVRTFALRRAGGGVRVTLGWVRGEGRVVWRLELRARGRAIRAGGAGPAGARQVARLVRLPASWRGARVTARLVLEDGSTRLVRVRSLVV